MKIVLIGRIHSDSSCRFIKRAFEFQQHNVFDLCQSQIRYLNNSTKQSIKKIKDNFNPDFIFLIKPNSIDLSVLEELSKNFPIIFYFYDAFSPNKRNYYKFLYIASISKIVLTANEEGAKYFSQVNPNTFILRQACNHNWIDIPSKMPSKRKKFFFFAGSVDSLRKRMIFEIKEWGAKKNKILDTFGAGLGEVISRNGLSKKTIEYQLCFNLPSHIPYDYISNRIYNTLGTKTPVISWECSELKKLFTGDKNIIFFQDKKSMYEKLDFYFNSPAKLDQIAINGYNLIFQKHTWDRRIQQIVQLFINYKQGIYT